MKLTAAYLAYGFLAAITYLLMGELASPVLALPVIASGAVVILLPFVRFQEIKSEFTGYNVIRHLSFSISQCLVAASLQESTVFNAFCSSSVGVIVATLAGRLLMRESISLLSGFGVLLALSASSVLHSSSPLTSLGIGAGVIQGVTAILSRRRGLEIESPVSMAAAAFCALAAISSIVVVVFNAGWSVQDIGDSRMLWIACGFAILQTAYCYLSCKVKAWLLSLTVNTRIPAAILISALFSAGPVSPLSASAGFLIAVGLVVAVMGEEKTQTPLLAK